MKECNYTDRVLCSKETKGKIEDDCKDEFLRNNPDFKGISLSNGFIMGKVVDYYLTHRCP